MIIAVDGPSASGKGTLAKAIAARLGYHYLDTGTLYRMVGLMMLRSGTQFSDVAAAEAFARKLDVSDFEDIELRGEVVGGAASKVAAIPAVREALLAYQRDFARRKPGAVLDGRDIGTVICPDADVKLFVTAAAPVRAARRHTELLARGEAVTREAVANDIANRDRRDAGRTLMAEDAIVIDSTELDAAKALETAFAAINPKLGL